MSRITQPPEGYEVVSKGIVRKGDLYWSMVGAWKPVQSSIGKPIERMREHCIARPRLSSTNPPDGHEIIKEGELQVGDLFWNSVRDCWDDAHAIVERVEELPFPICRPMVAPVTKTANNDGGLPPSGCEIMESGIIRVGDYIMHDDGKWFAILPGHNAIGRDAADLSNTFARKTIEPDENPLLGSW